MAQYKILSTKKISPSLKEEAMQKGIEIIEQEFIDIQPLSTKEKNEEVLNWATRQEKTAVVFTSRHAVNSTFLHLLTVNHYIPDWAVFCLSGATKNAVAEKHFDDRIIATAENAADLASVIVQNGSFNKVIFFCSNKRRDELPEILRKHGIEVTEVIVYETMETPVVTTDKLDAILFFSPSAVNSFFSVNTLSKKTTCFAIGLTTASAIATFTDNRVLISEEPTQEIMMASVWFYFQNINIYE